MTQARAQREFTPQAKAVGERARRIALENGASAQQAGRIAAAARNAAADESEDDL